jgi:hypothetical protein
MTARSIPHRRFAFTRGRMPGTGWERLTDKDFRDKPRRITSAAATSPRPAPVWARDLLELARAAFLVDKRFLREVAPDRWTRQIELHVQVGMRAGCLDRGGVPSPRRAARHDDR